MVEAIIIIITYNAWGVIELLGDLNLLAVGCIIILKQINYRVLYDISKFIMIFLDKQIYVKQWKNILSIQKHNVTADLCRSLTFHTNIV